MSVYDFDGTIYDGDSTMDFWKFCLKRHPSAILSIFPGIVGFCLYMFGLACKTQFKQRFYTFLQYIPDIESTLLDFWKAHEKKIRPWYLAGKQGNDIIISASPEFLLKPICEKLGIRLIASNVDIQTGVYTGENCYGEEKVQRLRAEFPNANINKFYSDSESDNPLARIASKAFWVEGNNIIPWELRKIGTIRKLKNAFLTQKFFMFLFCGGCATIINFFASLKLSFHLDSTLAYVLGYAFAIFFNYTLNTYLTFKMPFSFVRFVKFIISYIPNFLILTTSVSILLNVFHLPEILVYLVAAILAIPLTFIIVKFFAFRKNKKEEK